MEEKIKEFFLDVFSVELNGTLLALLIGQADALFKAYQLTEEQRELCVLLYIGCQISGPPYNLVPINQMVTSMSVRDFSASFSPMMTPLVGMGFCGALEKVLEQFAMENRKINGIIVV